MLETSPSDHYWWRSEVGQRLGFWVGLELAVTDTQLAKQKLGKIYHTPTMAVAIVIQPPGCTPPNDAAFNNDLTCSSHPPIFLRILPRPQTGGLLPLMNAIFATITHLAVVDCCVIRCHIGSSAPLLLTRRPWLCWVLHPSSLFVSTAVQSPGVVHFRLVRSPCAVAPISHFVSSTTRLPCKVPSAPLLLLCHSPPCRLALSAINSSHVPSPPSRCSVICTLAFCCPLPPLVMSSSAPSPLKNLP